MQQKLCLWLAVVVLLGALLAGNPFLVGRAALRGTKAPVVVPVAVPVTAPLAAPLARERQQQREPALAPRSSVPGSIPGSGGARFEATPALAVASTAAQPADASAELCPDLALRSRVVSVERDARGDVVWVLRDGSRWARNKKSSAGQPLLIAIDAAADVTR